MICPKCNTENNDNEKFCKNCGLQLNTTKICPNCNSVNKPDAKFCLKCGTTLSPVNTFKKDIIDKNAKSSFFGTYKIPIICALVIILAIGAVTGVTLFGSGNGDNGFNSIIPLSNDTFDDSNLNDYSLNHDDDKNNQTDDKNLSENKTTKNATGSKNLTDKNTKKSVDKNNKTSNNSNNNTKTYTEKTTKKTNKTNTDKTSDSSKSSSSNSDKSDNKNTNVNKDKEKKKSNPIIPALSDDDKNDSDSNDDLNDTDDLNDSDSNDDLNDTDDLTDGDDDMSSDSIEMTDVPNLAQEAANRNFQFSSISYNGHNLSDAQCIDIFAEYINNVNNGISSPIEIDSVSRASNPSGEDASQEISKSDYLSIASRVHSWIDNNNQVPNYVGVSTMGQADLSPDKMLELFSMVILNYSISEQLPESVDI